MTTDPDRTPLGEGWDSTAVLVDGRWVERTARRPDVEPWLRTETTLLPWLAPLLPLPVPVPTVVGEGPLVVRHPLIAGRAWTAPTPAQGLAVGAFLRALHAVPLDGAVARGVPGPDVTRGLRDTAVRRFAAVVLPRLAAGARDALVPLLERVAAAPASVLVHGDLNPEHVLIDDDGAVAGVIDWSDARAGDPAKDLSVPVHELPAAVGDAVLAGYAADAPTADVPDASDASDVTALRARAADWHRVAPCYAVVHGLDTDDPALVEASLAQLAARLPEPSRPWRPGPARRTMGR